MNEFIESHSLKDKLPYSVSVRETKLRYYELHSTILFTKNIVYWKSRKIASNLAGPPKVLVF